MIMQTGFMQGFRNKPVVKYYFYHGILMSCLIQPKPEPFKKYDTTYGPYVIYEQPLGITTLFRCGEEHWSPNLYNPFDENTCDPEMVKYLDNNYLYTKTVWLAGAGQALYNKESLLSKLTHKVVAIQSVTVYNKGYIDITVPGSHFSCGPNKAALYVGCTHTPESWVYACYGPGMMYTFSYEYTKCKPLFIPEHNWDMKTFEEDTKIGFRVDQCTETDPKNYGVNRTRCYWNYCLVKYKISIIITLPIQDPEWDVGTNFALLYGQIINAKNGYFIYGIMLWKKGDPAHVTEQKSTGNINSDSTKIIKYFSGLVPFTTYQYMAFLRNTGIAANTIYGGIKEFTTWPIIP